MATAPDILVRRGLDRGLVGTILASAAIHAAVVTVLVTMPGRWLGPSSKMESYTVDLVAPDVVGGTNLVPGGGTAKALASKAGLPVPPAPKPEPVAVQPPAAEPPEQAPPAPQVPPAAPKAMAPVEPPKPAEAPKVQEAAKVAEPPQPAVKLPEVKPVAPPKPPPVADAKPPEPKPAPPKAVEAPKAAAKPAAPAKPVPVAAAKPSEPPKKAVAAAKAVAATSPVDDEIAAAVQRRAAQVQSGAGGASRDLDKQIAAAVRRRAGQAGAGAGNGASGPGGLVSVGPGSGAGGTPAGIDYILYQGKMEEKIKAAWAWAGADKSRRAVIQFNLTPDGEIKNVRTIESSGDAQYDASCARAVRTVDRLEPVPERYRKEFATVELTFKPDDLEH